MLYQQQCDDSLLLGVTQYIFRVKSKLKNRFIRRM